MQLPPPLASDRASRVKLNLSRASWFGQRKRHALGIEGFHCLLDCAVKRIGVTEGLMREMVRFEVAPDAFDGVQFRRILWQPFDGEPVCAGGESCQGKLLVWIGPLSRTSTTGLAGCPGVGPWSRSSCSR
jgi:hypothetical protein